VPELFLSILPPPHLSAGTLKREKRKNEDAGIVCEKICSVGSKRKNIAVGTTV
jgi:hypothetical protein